jgi:ABC-2 type transport system ATP-binding protein
MTDTDFTLVASGLSRFFGDFCAVREVSFSIPRGEIFGLLGPNGAGKTTVLRCITGIVQPTDGRIEVDGHSDSVRRVGHRAGVRHPP